MLHMRQQIQLIAGEGDGRKAVHDVKEERIDEGHRAWREMM